MRPDGPRRCQRMATSAATVAILLAATFDAKTADACRCEGVPASRVASALADAVFEGRALTSFTSAPHGPSGARELRFRVVRAWKGVAAGTEATVAEWGDDCAYEFEAEKTYLVYAMRTREGDLTTNACTRTRTGAEAAEDIAALESGDAAAAGTPVVPPVARSIRKPSGCLASCTGAEARREASWWAVVVALGATRRAVTKKRRS